MSGVILDKIVTDGLILYVDSANSRSYEGGSTVKDLVSTDIGTANSVTPVYSVFYYSPYFDFDGTSASNWINMTNRIPALGLTLFTIDVWFKPSSAIVSAPGIFSSAVGSPNNTYYGFSIQLGALSGGAFPISAGAGNGGGAGAGNRKTLTTNSNVIIADSWNHVTATCDAFDMSFQIYVNGVLQTGATYSGSGAFLSWGTGTLFSAVGRSNGNDTLKYTGQISICKMYSKILSQDEVTQNYNANKKRFGL